MENQTKELNASKQFREARERDLLFGILLVIGSIALGIYAHSISTQAMAIMDAEYFTAPGFTILIIAIGLFAMAIYLINNALHQGADLKWLHPKRFLQRLKEGRASQTFIVFFYLYLYMVVLWENIPFTRIRIPFWLNTMIFMNLIMFTFKVTKPRNILIISIITSFSVHFVFNNLIGVQLP